MTRSLSATLVIYALAAGCVPDLGGYRVLGEGQLDCDFTRPVLAVTVNRWPIDTRIEALELGDGARPCGVLDGGGTLDFNHRVATWVPGTPVLALASSGTWQAIDVDQDRYTVELPSRGGVGGLDAFPLFDGSRWLAVFPADGGRSATEDTEQLLFFDVQDAENQRAQTTSELSLGGFGTILDCTSDPLDPSAMLCIRGGLSGSPAAAVVSRPFDAPASPIERVPARADVSFDRISSYPGGRIAWRASDDARSIWLAESDGSGMRGPYVCPQCAAVGDVVPDPFDATGFYVNCFDADEQGIVVHGNASECAIVHATDGGTPTDLSLRMP